MVKTHRNRRLGRCGHAHHHPGVDIPRWQAIMYNGEIPAGRIRGNLQRVGHAAADGAGVGPSGDLKGVGRERKAHNVRAIEGSRILQLAATNTASPCFRYRSTLVGCSQFVKLPLAEELRVELGVLVPSFYRPGRGL